MTEQEHVWVAQFELYSREDLLDELLRMRRAHTRLSRELKSVVEDRDDARSDVRRYAARIKELEGR